jgi:hypothetical protein
VATKREGAITTAKAIEHSGPTDDTKGEHKEGTLDAAENWVAEPAERRYRKDNRCQRA